MQYIYVLAFITIFGFITITGFDKSEQNELVEAYIKEHKLEVKNEVKRNNEYEIETEDKLYKITFIQKGVFDDEGRKTEMDIKIYYK